MEIIRELGAFAGLAAFIGLAVLALLYFAQARDVRRLRENAEFLVQGEGPEGAPAVPPPIGAEEETETGARAAAPPASDAEAFRRAELARQAAKRRERFEERRTGGGEGFEVPSTAVIVIGALILLAGIGFGATRLLGGDDEGGGGGGGAGKDLACPPGQTKVAVLNGTAEEGLAGASAAKLKQRQYDVGPIGNTDSAFDTSTVMFDQGSQPCAPEIGGVVGIASSEQMDQEILGIVEGAAVAVILGEDQVSGSTSSDSTSADTTDSGTLGE
jgi:hypothetical protein